MRAAESIWSTLWVIFGDPNHANRKSARAEFESLRTAKYDAISRRLDGDDIRHHEWEALQQDLKRRWDSWNVLGRRFGSDVCWVRHSPPHTSWGPRGEMMIIYLPLLFTIVGIRRLLASTPNTRIAWAMRRGRCPQCGYDLAGAEDPISRMSRGVVSPGPRLCPECGLRWPHVPPHLGPLWRLESAPASS